MTSPLKLTEILYIVGGWDPNWKLNLFLDHCLLPFHPMLLFNVAESKSSSTVAFSHLMYAPENQEQRMQSSSSNGLSIEDKYNKSFHSCDLFCKPLLNFSQLTWMFSRSDFFFPPSHADVGYEWPHWSWWNYTVIIYTGSKLESQTTCSRITNDFILKLEKGACVCVRVRRGERGHTGTLFIIASLNCGIMVSICKITTVTLLSYMYVYKNDN